MADIKDINSTIDKIAAGTKAIIEKLERWLKPGKLPLLAFLLAAIYVVGKKWGDEILDWLEGLVELTGASSERLAVEGKRIIGEVKVRAERLSTIYRWVALILLGLAIIFLLIGAVGWPFYWSGGTALGIFLILLVLLYPVLIGIIVGSIANGLRKIGPVASPLKTIMRWFNGLMLLLMCALTVWAINLDIGRDFYGLSVLVIYTTLASIIFSVIIGKSGNFLYYLAITAMIASIICYALFYGFLGAGKTKSDLANMEQGGGSFIYGRAKTSQVALPLHKRNGKNGVRSSTEEDSAGVGEFLVFDLDGFKINGMGEKLIGIILKTNYGYLARNEDKWYLPLRLVNIYPRSRPPTPGGPVTENRPGTAGPENPGGNTQVNVPNLAGQWFTLKAGKDQDTGFTAQTMRIIRFEADSPDWYIIESDHDAYAGETSFRYRFRVHGGPLVLRGGKRDCRVKFTPE